MRTTIIFLFFVAFVSTGNAQEPMFQWQKTGPFGGDITSVAGNDSFLLAGTGTARMFRSTNQGAAWNASSDGIGLKYIENSARDIVLTSQSQLAAVGFNYAEGRRFVSALYRSINQGQTWTHVTFATIDYNETSFLVASEDLVIAKIVASTPGSGFDSPTTHLSRDYGATWQPLTGKALGEIRSTFYRHPWFSPSMLQLGRSVLVAKGITGLARSYDKAETWTTATVGLPTYPPEINLGNPQIPTLHSLCKIDSTVFLAADTAVYVSSDTGRTWRMTDFRMPTLKQSKYPSILNALVSINGTLIASVIPQYYNEDGELPEAYRSDLSNKRLGLEGTLMRSDDKGKTWRPVPLSSLPYKVPQKLVAIGNDLYYLPVDVAAQLAVSINAGLWRSRNKGDTWEPLNDSIPAFYTNTVHQTADKRLFATTYGGRIFTKPNPQAKWERVLPTSMFIGFDEGAYNYLAVGNNLFATSFGRLFRSTDGAVTWTEQKPGFLILRGYPSVLRYFNGKMFACSVDTIFQSSDTGRTWQLLKQFGKKDEQIRNLAFDPATNLIFAEFRSDVFSSSDNGITWSANTTTAQYEKAKSTVLGNVLVQANSEPYNTDYSFTRYSRDNGVTWQKTNLGLPSAVTIVDIKVFDNTIFAATSEGIYQAALTGTSVSNPSESAVLSTFPNPSTDYTDLAFMLPRAAQVSAALYSTLGTEVWRSESATMSAGEQHIRIDTRHLPTGVYAYRLVVNGVSSVGRIVVVR